MNRKKTLNQIDIGDKLAKQRWEILGGVKKSPLDVAWEERYGIPDYLKRKKKESLYAGNIVLGFFLVFIAATIFYFFFLPHARAMTYTGVIKDGEIITKASFCGT